MNRIWGIEYEELYVDGKIFWKFHIRNPFKQNGGYKIGLNHKFLLTALQKGVEQFILKIGEREVMMTPPDKKELKKKVKAKEYKDKKSMFEGSPDMRIYFFLIG